MKFVREEERKIMWNKDYFADKAEIKFNTIEKRKNKILRINYLLPI